MTDAELRDRVLQYFYDNRSKGARKVAYTDIDFELGATEFGRICKQLKDLDLIEWKTPGRSIISPLGLGLITAKGTDQIEQKSHLQDKPNMAPRRNSNSPPEGRPSVHSEAGRGLLKEQIDKAEELLKMPLITGYHVDAWDNTTLNYIEMAFGRNHRNIEMFQNAMATSGNYTWSPEQWSAQYARDLRGKVILLEGFIQHLEKQVQLADAAAPRASKIDLISSRKVFIVHGHDGGLKEATARLVARLGLQPVILHEQTKQGRTIIENLSHHAREAGFAIVLLTADDVGSAGTVTDHRPLQARARQNVIFELGLFFALLEKGQVCAVYETGVELPSDLDGILYIPYDAPGKWQIDVAKEIREAGYEVDLNNL